MNEFLDYIGLTRFKQKLDQIFAAKQDKIDSSHKLSADLVEDGSTNKAYTATDKSKLGGIEAGAQVNVKPDWNAGSGSAAEILNKPTIPDAQIQSDWNQSDNTQKDFIKNKPTIPTVPVISTDIDADGASDSKTASPKAVKTFVESKGYLTQHQDISGKADKSEMSVTDGIGADNDKTTIQLKSGTSATVLKSHQSLAGKQDVIDAQHKLSADLVDDSTTTNKFTNTTEKQTWNNKQDTLVSGTNIKTINNESILGNGNITIQGGGSSNVFGPSGSGHSQGLVPDPGSTQGTSKYLREDATWVAQATSADVAALQPPAGELDPQGWEQEIAKKEDKLEIVAAVDSEDATLPVTALTCEIGKYYRLDVPVETLAVTLPVMSGVTLVKAVVLYLTGGTTPAVTISSTAVSGGVAPDVHYQAGYSISSGNTYEVSCMWNGDAWIVAGVRINVS